MLGIGLAEVLVMQRALLFLLSGALAGACSMGDTASDAPGGNVGFGGAQDIGQFRDILTQGGIPGPETLDTSGFFAEHYVELPAPTCGQQLCMVPMVARGTEWITGQRRTTLQLTVTTPLDPATLPRRPLDLTVVVDRSGSMAQDGRLDKVRDGLRLLLPQLREGDRLALVSFDDRIEVLASWGASRETLLAAIDTLSPRGSTNLYGGLEAGLRLASSVASTEREARVLFLSDGLATAGITSPSEILRLAETHVQDGIGVSTIGVGRDFDAPLMRGLSERGGGNFYFLEDASAVREVFTEELKVSMTPIALDVRFDVRFGAGYSLLQMVGRSGWTGSGSSGSLRIPAAFMASRDGAPPTGGRRGGGGALFFDLGELASVGDGVVATIDLSYRLPGSTERISQRAIAAEIAPASPDAPRPAVSHPAMQKLSAMYNLYRGLKEATYGVRNYASCAGDVLSRTRTGASRWNFEQEDADITADLALIDRFQANLRAAGFPTASESPGGVDYAPCSAPTPIDYVDEPQHMHCSAGGPAGGAMPLMLLALALRRRRRRHA